MALFPSGAELCKSPSLNNLVINSVDGPRGETGDELRGQVRAHRGVLIATIGLNLGSSLLEDAFTLLLGELNHEVTTAHADEPDLVICDLYSVGLEPLKLPTLVLVPNNDSDIIRVLRSSLPITLCSI